MKILSRTFLAVFITLPVIISCNETGKFNNQDLLLAKSFSSVDTAVYTSGSSKIDTIIFSSAKIDTVRLRSFEQGFYDEYRLEVNYLLTAHSYHKFLTKDSYKKELFNVNISRSHSSKELYFLGLVFDKRFIDQLTINNSEMIFDHKKATYNGVNINEAILSFDFRPFQGIVSFKDKNGNEWKRQSRCL